MNPVRDRFIMKSSLLNKTEYNKLRVKKGVDASVKNARCL